MSFFSWLLTVFDPSVNRLIQEVMTATVSKERIVAEHNSEEGTWAVFQGRNRLRFFIAAWPKIAQQLVGLSVFNTYAIYFCKQALCFMRLSLSLYANTILSPICRQ